MKNRSKQKALALLLAGVLGAEGLVAQISTNDLAGQVNTITSSVPFLTIAPDSRSGAMGDAGAALSPDANAQHWNPSRYGFVDQDMGVSLSYAPWLRHIVPDIDLAYLAGYKRLDKDQVLGASLRYFSLGNITFTNLQGQYVRDFNPNEFAIDLSYTRKLDQRFAAGVALRYIYSNLTGGAFINSVESRPGQAVAADLSAYYFTDQFDLFENSSKLSFGANFSNIGSKISYTDESQKNFLPINMRLGTALEMELDDYNSLTLAFDVNKLLIPTPPVYRFDSISGRDTLIGRDPSTVAVAQGIFGSFSDAPGGFREELNEIMYSIGLEYWYDKRFALRAGYFHENELKGNRKYFTFGMGLKLNVFALDFSYLVPAQGLNNPLANTLRFSLKFDFEGFREQAEPETGR